MWTVSDETLVAGLAAGDRDAASAFVQRFQRRVFGLARTIVVDDRAAEDIAQEAFVRAWKHAGAFDPRRGSVVGWLLTITRNLAIDALRRRRAQPTDPEVLAELRHLTAVIEAQDAARTSQAGSNEGLDQLAQQVQQLAGVVEDGLASVAGTVAAQDHAIEDLRTTVDAIRAQLLQRQRFYVERSARDDPRRYG